MSGINKQAVADAAALLRRLLAAVEQGKQQLE